jgi:hypothetical protein
MSAVSEIAIAEEALAHVEGLLKYGRYNYRIIGVRSSVYLDASRRHIAKYAAGEDRDGKTGVHHLGSARACLGIILECDALGNLVDDRGPKIEEFSARLDALESRMKHLREVFKEHNPQHYTINDKPQV